MNNLSSVDPNPLLKSKIVFGYFFMLFSSLTETGNDQCPLQNSRQVILMELLLHKIIIHLMAVPDLLYQLCSNYSGAGFGGVPAGPARVGRPETGSGSSADLCKRVASGLSRC